MTEELSERERKTKEALEAAVAWIEAADGYPSIDMKDALAQYKPKPKPVPVLPDYDSLTLHQKDWIATSIFNWRDTVGMKTSDVYNAIREITAKVPE